MPAEYYRKLFQPLYAGHRWIILSDAAVSASDIAQGLADDGAPGVMVVASTEGTGPRLPDDTTVAYVDTATADTMMQGIRDFESALEDPTDALCEAITAFDPTGVARVLASQLMTIDSVCNRPVEAPRRREWRALEDKMTADALWDEAGIERSASAIVDVRETRAIVEAIDRLASADGAVLVADNKDGWHGGGEYTRYLAPGADHSSALRFFVEHATRIRVMPFLRGVPCSIHGLVTDDGVLAFRPVEMLVYRREGSDEFVYAGMATLWDPPQSTRDQMRDAVRRVGDVLRRQVDYRGAFGIDGVCTDDGFFPTELNPRLTAGIGMQASTAGGYPIASINRAIVAGRELDLRLSDLEAEIVEGADATRSGRWLRPLTHLTADTTIERSIRFDGSTWAGLDGAGLDGASDRDGPRERAPDEDAPDGEPADEATATMRFGPSSQGALVFTHLTPNHGLTPGPPLAEIAAASFAVADELWDARIGPLVPGTRSVE